MSGSRTQLDLGCTGVQRQPLPVHCSNDVRTFPESNASKDYHTPTPWEVTTWTSNKRGKPHYSGYLSLSAGKCFTPKRWWGPKDKSQVPSRAASRHSAPTCCGAWSHCVPRTASGTGTSVLPYGDFGRSFEWVRDGTSELVLMMCFIFLSSI